MNVYCFDSEEWVVAESPEDAAVVYAEHVGPTCSDLLPSADYPGEWAALPDYKTLAMSMDDHDGPEIKTCAEWAKGGRRYLGSANY